MLQIETIIFFFPHCLFQETWEPSRKRFIGLKCKPCKSALFEFMKMWLWGLFFLGLTSALRKWQVLKFMGILTSEARKCLRLEKVGSVESDPWWGAFPEEKIILPVALISTARFLNTQRFVVLEIAPGIWKILDLSNFPSFPSPKAGSLSFYLEGEKKFLKAIRKSLVLKL